MKNLLLLIVLFPLAVFSQDKTQTIRGRVFDNTTQSPLIGAIVFVEGVEPRLGAVSDENGRFYIDNVPIGRRTVKCSYPGYTNYVSDNFILSTARETFLEIALIEEVFETSTEEVVITAREFPTKAVNDLAVVSTRSFNAEETGRYAASVNDPGRMALSLPGVQQGGDEDENDIIVRGNSSFGVLWRLEGIDIPNPNHFARPGTSGGGITVFSAQLLDRSDFSSGGMPAEYGNAIAGAYDIHFRKGNMENRDYRIKIGLLGLDFAAEGPFAKSRSSYLVNYRYSTLGLLSKFGVYVVGERVDNEFQDLSFNMAYNSKDGRTFVTWFGLGGISRERYNPKYPINERDSSIANHWEDRIRDSNMGATGVTVTRLLDEKSYLKVVVAAMRGIIDYQYDELDFEDNRFRYNDETYSDTRITGSLTYSRKISKRTRFKTGLFANQVFFTFYKQSLPRNNTSDITLDDLNRAISVDGEGQTQLLQTYAQFSHDLSPKLAVNAGAHLLYLNLNQTANVDPRVSLKYTPNKKNTFALAYGIHSQHLPLGQYYYAAYDSASQTFSNPNFDLKMIRSHHLIFAHNYIIGQNLRIGTDIYFQRLFNVPVTDDPESSWWMLNNQSGIAANTLLSEGKGMNYGVNVFLEKFFSQQIFFLLTFSRFESKYELPDGRIFNTRFGTKFGSSLTVGKEFTFSKGGVLQIGARAIYNGGLRYTTPDWEMSRAENRFIGDPTKVNASQVGPYFRIDSRISYRSNPGKRFASVLSLDIQNVLDQRNPNNVGWSNGDLDFRRHGGGFVPVLAYQMDF